MVAAKPTTASELLALTGDDARLELIEGELTEMSPAGPQHGRLAGRLSRALARYLDMHDVAELWARETGYVLASNPDTVLAPDLTLVEHAQAAKIDESTTGFATIIPMIAIEIKPPFDRESSIARKLAIYLEAGVSQVWIIRPESRTLTVHTPDRAPITLGDEDTLTGGDELPGFSLRIDELFTV